VGFRIIDSNNNLECALQTGILSGALPPVWNTAIGGITTELTTLQWRNGGPLASHALPVAGGASGIITSWEPMSWPDFFRHLEQ
jgi:hypothetical protein